MLSHLTTLRQYFRENKQFPSFEVLRKVLGFRSKGSVSYLFRELVKMGYLRKEKYSFIPLEPFFGYKVYESIRAGFPSPANEENAKNIDLDTYLIPQPESTILTKVTGDSMIEAGIHAGDIVIIDKGLRAKPGDIIIAEIDGDFTLKYLMREKGRVFLRAGNPKYPDFFPREELKIFGKVVGVVRKYQP